MIVSLISISYLLFELIYVWYACSPGLRVLAFAILLGGFGSLSFTDIFTGDLFSLAFTDV